MKFGYLVSDDITKIHELPSDEIKDNRGIYVIVNIITNKVYVGKTEKSFGYRNNVHSYELNHNCHINKHLQNSWKKYGENAFIFCVHKISPYKKAIASPLKYKEFRKWLDITEIKTIQHFRSILPHNAVYNYNDGGEGGVNPTSEISKKLHDKDIESWKHESTRRKRIEGIKRACKKNSESGKLSKVQEECWKNQEIRENRISGVKNAYNDPIKKQRHLDGVRKFYNSIDGRWQLAKLQEKRWENIYTKIYQDIEKLGVILMNNKEMYDLVVR